MDWVDGVDCMGLMNWVELDWVVWMHKLNCINEMDGVGLMG